MGAVSPQQAPSAMVWARNPVYAAMCLMATFFALTMFSIAVFYLLNSGFLIAAVQVIVYAGAVLTLFLFVDDARSASTRPRTGLEERLPIYSAS